jgi:hypothetical protein
MKAVAAATVEWLLSVRSRDLRGNAGQRARRADADPPATLLIRPQVSLERASDRTGSALPRGKA